MNAYIVKSFVSYDPVICQQKVLERPRVQLCGAEKIQTGSVICQKFTDVKGLIRPPVGATKTTIADLIEMVKTASSSTKEGIAQSNVQGKLPPAIK